MAGDDTDERRTVAGQRLHVERTVREHRTATVEGFVFRSVRVHMHYDTGIVVGQVGVLPAGVHHTAVIHDDRIPVGVLVECQAAHALVLRVIQHHVTYRIATVHTRNTLVTDVGDSDHTTVGQVSTIVELQIRLVVFHKRLEACPIQIHFIDVPALVVLCLCEHHTVTVPMQFQVSDGRTVFRFVDLTHLYIATQIGEFDDLGIEALTTGRLLVTPVIGLSPQGRSHDLVCLRTYLETGCHDLVGIQQRVSQQDGTFAFQCFLGIGDSLFVTVIDAFETFLFEPYQFVQHRFVFGGVVAFLLFHIGESQFDSLDVQPFQIALKRVQLLYFLNQFEIFAYLCIEIFFVCDLLCHIRIVGSVLQPGDRIIRSLLFD